MSTDVWQGPKSSIFSARKNMLMHSVSGANSGVHLNRTMLIDVDSTVL